MQDVKMTDQFAGHEIAGQENDGPKMTTGREMAFAACVLFCVLLFHSCIFMSCIFTSVRVLHFQRPRLASSLDDPERSIRTLIEMMRFTEPTRRNLNKDRPILLATKM